MVGTGVVTHLSLQPHLPFPTFLYGPHPISGAMVLEFSPPINIHSREWSHVCYLSIEVNKFQSRFSSIRMYLHFKLNQSLQNENADSFTKGFRVASSRSMRESLKGVGWQKKTIEPSLCCWNPLTSSVAKRLVPSHTANSLIWGPTFSLTCHVQVTYPCLHPLFHLQQQGRRA